MGVRPAHKYMLKVTNRGPTIKCKICSKLAITIPEQSTLTAFGVFIEHVWYFALVFLSLTVSMYLYARSVV